MTPEFAPSTDAPALSEASRLSAVFFDPRRAFSDIAARPRWVVPLLLSLLVSLAFVYTFSRRVGWEHYLERTLETNPRTENLSLEQRRQIVEQQLPLVSAFGYAGAALGAVFSALVVSAVLLFVANVVFGAQLLFRQMFALTCYGFLPNALAGLLGILMMFLKAPEDFDLENPTAFNIGAYLDPQATPKWLVAVASSLDLFSIWVILLLALGMATASRKLSYGKALAAVLAVWVLWVALKAARYALF